jgi:valyl-tRNA synthetase
MPSITEEIWHKLYKGRCPTKSIALARFPLAPASEAISEPFVLEPGARDRYQFGSFDHHQDIDLDALVQMAILQDLIVSVRNLRAELKVETKAKIPIEFFTSEPEIRALVEENRIALERLANIDEIRFMDSSLEKLAGARHTARFDVRLVYEKKIDTTAECVRLKKELDKIEKGIETGQRQLANENFLAKAPANVVENLRKQQTELGVLQQKTRSKLNELGCG